MSLRCCMMVSTVITSVCGNILVVISKHGEMSQLLSTTAIPLYIYV